MSSLLSVDTALALIPDFTARKWCCQQLRGGLTNRNYKIECNQHCFVLRLDDKHTKELGLNRAIELKARNMASARRIAANVIFSDSDRGILLSEYLPGKIWRAEDLTDQQNLESLAELLQQVHSLPRLGTQFDAGIVAQRYVDKLNNRPDLLVFGQKCRQLVANTVTQENICCCHNDIIAGNIVAADNLKLLDWEYACDNDPLFDLACVIAFQELDKKSADILLSAYAGGVDGALREHLEGQIRLFDAIQWLWFAARQCISPDLRQNGYLEALRRRIDSRIPGLAEVRIRLH